MKDITKSKKIEEELTRKDEYDTEDMEHIEPLIISPKWKEGDTCLWCGQGHLKHDRDEKEKWGIDHMFKCDYCESEFKRTEYDD